MMRQIPYRGWTIFVRNSRVEWPLMHFARYTRRDAIAAFKATGLYTRGLPQLVSTNRLTPPKPGDNAHKAWSAIHRAPPGPDRWKVRSKTFEGMAEAWADQWGGYAMERVAA